MPIADSLNPNFSLPDMGDYYYDAPDQQRFYSEMDNILNPLHKLDLNQGAVSKFYCCTPPALGAKNETYTFSVTLQGGGVNADSEYVRGIRVDDGDTISVPLAYISGGDDESKKYLDQIAADAKAISAITGGADVSKAKLTLRFAGIDCKELPHFTKAGTDEVTSKEEVFYIEDALKDGQFVCSKYKSFMDDPEYNENLEGGVPIGKFYHYSREMKQANFVKMVDGCWHQYFGMGDDMYVLRKCDCNSYDESVIEDAGVARDVVANAIAAASEMRIQVDGAKLSKNAQIIHTKFGTKPYDDSPANTAKKFLDMFFDDYTEFTNAGFNCFGLDAYGRAIAVVYLCIGGKWINLNKMVVADTNDTEVNKYAAARDGAIDTSSFDFDAAQYADSLYKQSKEFDDRDEVQGEIFKTLGKGASLQALSDWTVIIGDVALMVPPTSIRCLTQSKSEHLPVLRAKGTMAKSATKMQRIIEMDIYFNGDNGINGYKYETNTRKDKKGKNVTYWMNGLRALYAQFRVAPFLPITNTYINDVLGVDAVTMISFSCDTVPNFPRLIKASIQLAEFEYRIYMPEIPRDDGDDEEGSEFGRNYFAEQINYPLLRYYYQRFLMHGEELRGVDFLDDKYVTSTFGNRTCLVPCDFKDPYIKFYIPNREHLEKLKQARLQSILKRSQGSDAATLNDKDMQYAGDMAKLANEISYLQNGGEGNYSSLSNLNSLLSSKEYAEKHFVLAARPGDQHIHVRQQVVDSDGNTTFEDTDETEALESKVKDYLDTIETEYSKGMGAIKNSEGAQLYTHGQPTTEFDASTGKFSFIVKGSVDTKYMTDSEMNNVKTLSTAEGNGDYSADDVMKDRELSLPFTVNLAETDVKANKDGNWYAVSIGNAESSFFQVDTSKDVGFLASCAAIDEKQGAGGNEEVEELNKSVSLVTKNTVKFEPYNDSEDFLVEGIHINTSNSFSQITLQETNGFAPQYVGGTDVSISLSLYTQSKQAAAAINALPSISAEYARNYRLVLTAWPLRIETEFTKMFGITEVMVESVEVDTVPNFPGLYHISMMMVSVDRTLRNREAMQKKDMQNFHNLSVEGVAAERTWSYNELNKCLSEAELYPDLELPTLKELSDMGFNFIRYSNEDRVYPDPDFYFTYSYVLTSQLVREAVLRSLNSTLSETTITDSMGRRIKGNLKTGMGSWERNYEPDDTDEMQNLFSDPEEQVTARIITDFMHASKKERDEVWTIAPNLKVAFAEKRILNHLNDHEKQRVQESHGQKTMRQLHPTNADEVIDTKTKSVDKDATPVGGSDASAAQQGATDGQTQDSAAQSANTQTEAAPAETTPDASAQENAAATAAGNGSDDDADEKPHKETEAEKQYNEMVAQKYEAYTAKVGKMLEDVFNDPLDKQDPENMIHSLYQSFGEADFAPYSDQRQAKDAGKLTGDPESSAKDNMKEDDAELDKSNSSWMSSNSSPWESGVIDKWLDAAADALHSNGNCDYSPEFDSPTKEALATAAAGAVAVAGVVGTVMTAGVGAGVAAALGGTGLVGTVHDAVAAPSDSEPWKRKQEWYAKIVHGDNDVREEFEKPAPLEASIERSYGEYGDWIWIDAATYNSIEFGPFNFKFYTEDELRTRFGDYGKVSEKAKDNGRFGLYLADPYYRDQPRSVQNDYVFNCITDYDFAKKAFLRICLLYLRVMISYDIIPSFSYDVFRGALKDKENMEKVLKAIQKRRDEKEKKEKEQSEKGRKRATSLKWKGDDKAVKEAEKAAKEAKDKADEAQKKLDEAKKKADESGKDEDKKAVEKAQKDLEDAQKASKEKDEAFKKAQEEHAKKSSGAVDMNASGPTGDADDYDKDNGTKESNSSTEGKDEESKDGNSVDTAKSEEAATSMAESTVAEYMSMFKKNQGAIDNGKTFLMVLMGVLDGNTDFLKLLIDRKYSSLKGITQGCMEGKAMATGDGDGKKSYLAKARSFIRACAGEQLIDKSKIGSGDVQEPSEVFSQFNGRKNIAAASDDPSKYLVHSFYDMVVHDCRGRMLRAFPTFYFCLIDEGRKIGRWKLHDNFYNVNSIASITVSKSRKIPTDTAEVVMSNFYNTFTDSDETLNNNYTANFTDVFKSIWLPTLESYAVDQEKKRTDAKDPERFRIRPGARIHIRFGYGADASALPTMFNGMVAECETSDTVKLVCQSDGAEICKPVMLEKDAHELPGMDTVFGFENWCESGATPKQILTALLTYKGGAINSWAHEHGYDDIANHIGTPINPLGIYHFGNPDIKYAGDPEPIQNIMEVGVANSQDRYVKPTQDGSAAAVAKTVNQHIEEDKEDWKKFTEGDAIDKGVQVLKHTVGAPIVGAIKTAELADAFLNPQEPPRVNFEVFGKTVWDIANLVKSVAPDYYVGIIPFHLRSTLFMGRSHDYVAYDYENVNGQWVEKRKPYQQAHIYDSCTDIITNSIKVSTKDIKTCAVGLYEVSGFMNAKVQKKTDPQWVDANIYPEYQKTMYVDTKLFGEPSRKFSYASDVINWLGGGIMNSTLDRAFDENGDVQNHHAMAVKMTCDALKQQMKEMYAGQLTVIGDPTIKPNDRIILNDTYDGIGGQCLVRDVVQVFSADAGYKTVITPDLITAQVGQDAADEMKTQNYGLVATNAVMGALAAGGLRHMGIKSSKWLAEAKGYYDTAKGTKAAKTASRFARMKKRKVMNTKTLQGLRKGLGYSTEFLTKMAEHFKQGKKVGSVISGGGKLIGTAIRGGKMLWNVAKLADLPMTIICTLGLGAAEDFIASKINSRKRLVLFPLQKYQRPMVGGVDGNVGTVFGSPNFESEGGLRSIFNMFKEKCPGLMNNIEWVGKVIGVQQDEANQRLEKVANSEEGKAQLAYRKANNSQLELFRNAYFNPAKTRLDVRKASSIKYAQQLYGVTENDQDGISESSNFAKMKPVIGDKRLKDSMNLGFFRVAAFERGFTSAISDKVHCMYLKDPKSKKYLPVNAIVDSSNGTVDIPYLAGDALGVLCDIVKRAFNYMAGTEQERDAAQWYKDNADSFITLTSALKCGSSKNYESTGYSFVLDASDDKSLKALTEAAKHINEMMNAAHQKSSQVPEKVLEMKESGKQVYIVVCPPKTVEEI